MRKLVMGALSIVVSFACTRKRAETIVIPTNHRSFYLAIAPLEPPTFSRLAFVDWQFVTTNGTLAGTTSVTQGSDVEIAFPGTSDIVSFSLRGRDAGDHLRAEGLVLGSALNSSTASSPAVLFFPLYGEFQAYPASEGPNLAFSELYVDSSDAPVLVGGLEQFPSGTPTPSAEVRRFDVNSGDIAILGRLNVPRANFTMSPRFYFSAATHEDLVVGGGSTSIEVWDRLGHVSALQGVSLACSRRQPTIVPYIQTMRWKFLILGGNDCGTGSAAGENLDFVGPAIGNLTTIFDSSAPDIILASGTLPSTVTFYQWFGNAVSAGVVGKIYLSTSAASTGTFNAPGSVNSRIVVSHASNRVLWPGSVDSLGKCRTAVEITPTGIPPPATYSWSEDICAPALATIDGDHIYVIGGTLAAVSSIRDSVKIFEFSTNTLRDAVDPSGAPLHLVYPRQNARAVQLNDKRIVVMGGLTSDLQVHPRMEVMIPGP